MDSDKNSATRSGISTRVMELVVAAFIFALGALVVYDSYRLGSKWGSDGPQSGYFPFYVGSLLCIASGAILLRALAATATKGDLFVTWGPLKLVMTVLLPAIVYVLAVQFIGL